MGFACFFRDRKRYFNSIKTLKKNNVGLDSEVELFSWSDLYLLITCFLANLFVTFVVIAHYLWKS